MPGHAKGVARLQARRALQGPFPSGRNAPHSSTRPASLSRRPLSSAVSLNKTQSKFCLENFSVVVLWKCLYEQMVLRPLVSELAKPRICVEQDRFSAPANCTHSVPALLPLLASTARQCRPTRPFA